MKVGRKGRGGGIGEKEDQTEEQKGSRTVRGGGEGEGGCTEPEGTREGGKMRQGKGKERGGEGQGGGKG